MTTNAEKIATWRKAHRGGVLTERILLDVLGLDTLRGADLRGADLRRANLRGADLRRSNLYGANLWDADLRRADLYGANRWGSLRVDGLASGQVTMVPTPDGWHVTVGCWSGTVGGLRDLIAGDRWPEAVGEEQALRRPGLVALCDLLDAHAVYHAGALAAVVEKWGPPQGQGQDLGSGLRPTDSAGAWV